jgi:hypothetical protein
MGCYAITEALQGGCQYLAVKWRPILHEYSSNIDIYGRSGVDKINL